MGLRWNRNRLHWSCEQGVYISHWRDDGVARLGPRTFRIRRDVYSDFTRDPPEERIAWSVEVDDQGYIEHIHHGVFDDEMRTYCDSLHEALTSAEWFQYWTQRDSREARRPFRYRLRRLFGVESLHKKRFTSWLEETYQPFDGTLPVWFLEEEILYAESDRALAESVTDREIRRPIQHLNRKTKRQRGATALLARLRREP